MSCHNGEKPAGQLRLGSLEALAAGGASGAAVHPGESAESNIYKRITAVDPALRMPPSGPPLPSDRVAAIKRWIDAGADGLVRHVAGTDLKVDFARDVEPILKTSCIGCHSGPHPK